MNFVFRFGTHPNISHYVYTYIPKSEKNLKSETLLVRDISGKGHLTYTCMTLNKQLHLWVCLALHSFSHVFKQLLMPIMCQVLLREQKPHQHLCEGGDKN